MAAQLAAMLQVQGEKGRDEWSKLHGELAEVAAAATGDDPRSAVQALLRVAKDASSSQALMRTLEERVSKANPGQLKYLVLLVADQLNMTPLCDSETVHMVDEYGNFCQGNVDRIINSSAELSAPNAPYTVVSIVGEESIGKSYLLNRLFGTKFPEMDTTRRGRQGTRGIMMSRCIWPSLLVLDVEGFAGREEGKDTTFLKQATLFALKVSDLMMVNVSIFDIGPEQGGATSLFRTIFQERTKLPQGFTKILVVLRCYDGETPFGILSSHFLKSLRKIWETVNGKSVKFRDYIEVNIIGLPDKYSPEFPKEVTLLRKLISNKSAKVRASSFSLSSRISWDTTTLEYMAGPSSFCPHSIESHSNPVGQFRVTKMGENDAALKDMAAQLVAMLRVQGEKGWEAWSHLHGKLAEVAAVARDDQRAAVQALLKVAKDASSSQALMRTLEERVSKANPDLLKYLLLLVADELNMTPLGDSEPLHMVDQDGNFCEGNVDRIFDCSTELSAPNAPYAVVSIVGAQSSGKSYLLNRLFGTKFPEMNASRGRSQTSRGIMMSRCIGPSLLVLDVEGFDGREKGQDTLFEKQAALFVLAVSDLMMVNISMHDIGRQQASGTDLFRTIFKERTKLQGAGSTKILVVLRHYDGQTPLETLRSGIMKSLEEIWEDVNEESVKFKHYIEVNIIGLPENYMPEFPKEVTVLRKLLSKNRSAKVPASSFLASSSMFWDTIKQNKELDIPSHQVAIARLYCRQLVEDTLNSLYSQEKYKLLKAEESPGRFKEISHELLGEIKTEYDLKTKMYDSDVRENERQYLVERLHKILTNDSRELIWKVQENTLEQFQSVFHRNTQNIKEADVDLYFERIMDACFDKFMSSCEDLKVFDSDYIHKICGELKKKMQSYTALHIVEIKVTVARLYCQQLVEDILNSLISQEEYKLLKVQESPGRFKEISDELLGKIKTEYDLKTKMYDSNVRDKERQYLVERLHKILTDDSRELIRKVQENTLDEFQSVFHRNTQNIKEADVDLYFERIMDACFDKFTSSCEDLKVFDSDYIHKICWELKKKMQSYTALHIVEIKVTVARLYCQQLVEDILNSLISLEEYKLLKVQESPGRFKKISDELLGKIKAEYDLKTKMYDPDVRDKERQHLVQKLHMIFTDDSRELIRKVQENTLEQLKGVFDRNTQNMNEADAYLCGEQIVVACIEKFMSSCEDLKVFDSDHLHRIGRKLEKKMRSYTALRIQAIKEESARKDHAKKLALFVSLSAIKLCVSLLTVGVVNLN